MITIFTIPKAFKGQTEIAQINAIRSWNQLNCNCQILLIGSDPGVAEIADELNLGHVSFIEKNSSGTPLLGSAFKSAQDRSMNDLICYINADIILLSDFLGAVKKIKFNQFLMIGRRWNIDIETAIDFQNPEWEVHLREQLAQSGILHPPTGSDYFLFCKGTLGDIPDFAVGRPGWDNWMIYNARKKGMPVVDATLGTTVIHQSHDYGHIKHRYDSNTYRGPEADRNKELMGDRRTLFDLKDATHTLDRDTLMNRRLRPRYIYRMIRTLPALHPWMRRYVDAVRRLIGTENN